MRALRLIHAAVAAFALAGCATYNEYYYAGDRGPHADRYGYVDRYERGGHYAGTRYHGDYWYRSGPAYDLAPPLYESVYYWQVLRPVYAWTWDPWYAPGWYYGVTYFPSPRWTSHWYVGWYHRPSWHYYSPWRYSWADNWYDWYGWQRGYGWGPGYRHDRRARERHRWRDSYVDDYRHTYRDRYSTPRFGSAYNEATWLADAGSAPVAEFGRGRPGDDAPPHHAPGPGPDGHDRGRVQRWVPAPGSGTVGDADDARGSAGGGELGSDPASDGRARWAGGRGPEVAPDLGPEDPGRRWAAAPGREVEAFDPDPPARPVGRHDDGREPAGSPAPVGQEGPGARWVGGEGRDYETLQPIEPVTTDADLPARDRWAAPDARAWRYREDALARERAYTDARAAAPAQDAERGRWVPRQTSGGEREDVPRWHARTEPRFEPRVEPRWEVREQPRFESRDEPRWEARAEPRFEPREAPRWEPPPRADPAPRYEPPERDHGGRHDRFDRGGDEPPY